MIDLVREKHASVFSYNIPSRNTICSQKIGNKLQVCFCKNTLPNGFGFVYLIRGNHGGFNPELNKK